MKSEIKKYYSIHTIWVVLVMLTFSTYAMGTLGFSGLPVVIVLLLTTAIKGILIIRDFMELHGVSLLWRVIMYGWLWVVIIAISMTYAMTS